VTADGKKAEVGERTKKPKKIFFRFLSFELQFDRRRLACVVGNSTQQDVSKKCLWSRALMI
jgi:hypothetical protein